MSNTRISICTLVVLSFSALALAQVSAPLAPVPPVAPITAAPAATAASTSESMGRVPSSRTPYTGAKEIHWVRDSAEYRACAIQAFAWATRLAEEGAKNETSGTWAVVVDADETVLDNSQFQKEVGSEGYTPAKWDEWVRREEAVAIPGAIAFLTRVRELGGKVAVVTNRKATEQVHTEANFKKAGLPYDLMLCQKEDRMKDSRFDAVQNGTAAPGIGPLKVLVFCGDNIQDFPKQRQEIRLQPESAMSDWGKKYITIPNPMYGSWVNNPER